jgi:hypothetical protein
VSKGSATAAQNNQGVEQSIGENYNGQAAGVNSAELPFLQNELTNPQGMGQQALSQEQTQGGQAVAGATGAANEQAQLLASRTGNTAAVPGIIDSTARNAMKQQSANVNSTDLANAQLKQQQQQEGSAGLEKMYGTDVSAALQALGLSNNAISDWTAGKSAANNSELGWLGAANAGAVTGNNINNGK